MIGGWTLARRAVVLVLPLECLAMLVIVGCVGREFQPEPTAIPPLAASDGDLMHETALSIDCLDTNGDHEIDRQDLSSSVLPDLNFDGISSDADVAILETLTIPLNQRCNGDRQFTVGPAPMGAPRCPDERFAVILGIVGAAPQGLLEETDGKGVVDITTAIGARLAEEGVAFARLLSTPNLPTASNEHAAIETWLEDVIGGILTAYPCADLVTVGHSHGASTALAVAAWLERNGYAPQMAYVAVIDRVVLRYRGDSVSVPVKVPLEHFYQLNGGEQACVTALNGQDIPTQNGAPITGGANLTEVDLSDRGLCHSNVDDDPFVQGAIVDHAVAAVSKRRGSD